MKWTSEQVEQLRKLATDGIENKIIAGILSITPEQVYRKRSSLGITIKKVQALSEAESVPTQKIEAPIHKPCPCTSCASRCYVSGRNQVVINCPYYVSPAARRREYYDRLKRQLLEDLRRPNLSQGRDLLARSDYDRIARLLDEVFPNNEAPV